MNRKLIRPNLNEIKEKIGKNPPRQSAVLEVPAIPSQPPMDLSTKNSQDLPSLPQGTASPRRKIAPPEQTNAESFYYLKQMQSKTPMVLVLQNDEKIRGIIEWYDKHCLKINRIKEPNLLVPKHNIKYIYKQEEEPRLRRSRPGKKDEPQEADLPQYE